MYFNQQEDRAMTILKHIQDVKTMLGQDVIVLFIGKRFYEAYGDDALKIKSCCECITDSRISEGERLEMCAFEIGKLDINLPKLVRSGYRVAISDIPKTQGKKSK
jgi:DNA mismatch repair protein MutS